MEYFRILIKSWVLHVQKDNGPIQTILSNPDNSVKSRQLSGNSIPKWSE